MLLRLNLILACFAISISAWAAALEDYKAGDAFYQQKQYAAALEKYQAAVQAKPDMWQAQMGLGNALFHLGKTGEAVKAYDKSLALNPNNPTLKAFVDKIRPKPASETLAEFKPIPAPATSPASTAASLSKPKGKTPGLFFNLYGGYDYALLTDINNALKRTGIAAEWIYTNPTNTFAAGNSGIATGLEIGLMLDKTSAISLDPSFIMGSTISYRLEDASSWEFQKVTPSLLGGTLNYKLMLPLGTGLKMNLGLGVGWYLAMLNFDYQSLVSAGPPPVIYQETASFTGDAIGGAFSIGTEIALGDSFAIGITAKGRWASFTKVTTAAINTTSPPPGGPFALTLTDWDTDGNWELYWNPVSTVDGITIKYAPVDMSGVQGNLSFILYI